ncbi:MAG: tetratricopeptide repeat protein, partial [Bacteroidota bacterium]
DNASTIFPEMDRTLEKCSKTIENHSMIFKNKEVNRWIDDSWLLMGKGHFYKRDLTLAKQTFDYTAKRYKDTESRYPALMWLARVNIEEEDYNKAGRLLDLIAGEGKLPQSLKAEYSAIYADFYIRQRNYALAIPELKDAIEHVRKKKTKTRWLFLLAQLYELDGNPGFASGLYAQVIKRNPPYDMAFAAKIKRALAFDVSSGDPEAIKKILFKMLRDDKNREYKDQIYYALAEIELKEKHDSLGIDYLKKATREGSSDTRVKGLAFLRLADIHFAVPKYRLAQAYYDSTVQFINPAHPDIDAIRGKAESLTQLVQDIEIIELEDSLQALAKLSESDLNLVIDDLIERIEEEEERQRLKEAFRQSQVNQVQQNQARTVAVGGNNRGAWYFYNPGSVGFGISDFKKIWGNRRLADHWRRSDKGTSSNLSTASLNPDEGLYPEDTLEGGNDPKNRNYYRKNIPFTDDKLKRSNGRIIEALYDLAVVYKDKLKDQPEAAKTFEELLQRYDSTHYHLNTYYQLYLLYDKMGLSAKSDYYKNILLNDYAGTEYARSIRNPGSSRG